MPDDPMYVDRFMLTEPVERDRLGWWYRASAPDDSTPYRALVMTNEFLSESVAQRAVELAGQLTAAQHPRLLRMYAAGIKIPHVGPSGGYFYAVVDPVDESRNLESAVLPKAPVPEKAAVRMGIDLVDVLAVCARHGAPHGWLQPDRVFVGDDKRIVVTNPWIGWVEEHLRSANTSGTSDWAFTWVAPETITDPDAASLGSDLFTLCAMLYATLAGRPPFDSASELALDSELFQVEAPDVRESNPAVSEGMARVLARGLAVDPGKRFPTPLDLRNALVAVGRGEPVASPGARGAARRVDPPMDPTPPSAPALPPEARRPVVGVAPPVGQAAASATAQRPATPAPPAGPAAPGAQASPAAHRSGGHARRSGPHASRSGGHANRSGPHANRSGPHASQRGASSDRHEVRRPSDGRMAASRGRSRSPGRIARNSSHDDDRSTPKIVMIVIAVAVVLVVGMVAVLLQMDRSPTTAGQPADRSVQDRPQQERSDGPASPRRHTMFGLDDPEDLPDDTPLPPPPRREAVPPAETDPDGGGSPDPEGLTARSDTGPVAVGYHRRAYIKADRLKKRTPDETTRAADITLAAAPTEDPSYSLFFETLLVVPADGTYQFRLASDDDSHLWLADEHRIANGGKHEMRERSFQRALRAGAYRLQVGHTQRGGESGLDLTWGPEGGPLEPLGPSLRSCEPASITPDILALSAERPIVERYYSNSIKESADFLTRMPDRVTTTAIMDAGSDIDEIRYSIRFDGHLQVAADGRYRFEVASNDRSWLWLDDALVIAIGDGKGLRTRDAEVDLTAGLHRLRLGYTQLGHAKELSLRWGAVGSELRPIETAMVVPGSATEPPPGPSDQSLPTDPEGDASPPPSDDAGPDEHTIAEVPPPEDTAPGGEATVPSDDDAGPDEHTIVEVPPPPEDLAAALRAMIRDDAPAPTGLPEPWTGLVRDVDAARVALPAVLASQAADSEVIARHLPIAIRGQSYEWAGGDDRQIQLLLDGNQVALPWSAVGTTAMLDLAWRLRLDLPGEQLEAVRLLRAATGEELGALSAHRALFERLRAEGVPGAEQEAPEATGDEPQPLVDGANDVILRTEDGERVGDDWRRVKASGAVNGAAWESKPSHPQLQNLTVPGADAPHLAFDVDLVAGVEYQLWIRGRVADAGWGAQEGTRSDSVFLHLEPDVAWEGEPFRNKMPEGVPHVRCNGWANQGRDWSWVSGNASPKAAPGPLVFRPTRSGRHRLRIWALEGPLQIDKVWFSAFQRTRPPGELWVSSWFKGRAPRYLANGDVVLFAAGGTPHGDEWHLRSTREHPAVAAWQSVERVHHRGRPPPRTGRDDPHLHFRCRLEADREYRLWLRGRAVPHDGKMMYSDAVALTVSPSPTWRGEPFRRDLEAGTDAVRCNGWGRRGDGWQWVSGDADPGNPQRGPLVFTPSEDGIHDIRIYLDEGPIEIDQIWLATKRRDQPKAGPFGDEPLSDASATTADDVVLLASAATNHGEDWTAVDAPGSLLGRAWRSRKWDYNRSNDRVFDPDGSGPRLSFTCRLEAGQEYVVLVRSKADIYNGKPTDADSVAIRPGPGLEWVGSPFRRGIPDDSNAARIGSMSKLGGGWNWATGNCKQPGQAKDHLILRSTRGGEHTIELYLMEGPHLFDALWLCPRPVDRLPDGSVDPR